MNKVYSEKVRDMANNLKKKLQKDLCLNDQDYLDIMAEVNEYEKELKRAEKSMERTKTKFIEAHQHNNGSIKIIWRS